MSHGSPVGQATRNQTVFTSSAVVLTGPPRSGTTLLGKIVGSLSGLEYHFEPPTLYMILCQQVQGRIAPDVAADLLRVYLYEDLLVESLHGRRVNLRTLDDSCVFNSIPREEIERRWRTTRNRAEAQGRLESDGNRVCFKMPNIHDALGFVREALPRSQTVLIVRDGRDAVASMLKKGWLTDAALAEELWPHVTGADGRRAPYWVEPERHAWWHAATPEDRAVYMWRRHADWALDHARETGRADPARWLEVRYEFLRAAPDRVVAGIAAFLGARPSALTGEQLGKVRSPDTEPHVWQFLDRIGADERARFEEVNAAWGYGLEASVAPA